jgi:hypothetical protein
MAASMKSLICLGLLALTAGTAPCAAADVELLPDVAVRLEAARYVPTDPDIHFTGWIGAGAGLVRAGSVTAYFDADVETILGWVRRPFEANQANYHLEPGLRRPLGAYTGSLFFHHVSRHAVDRAKPEAVDWNMLGVRLVGPADGAVRLRASAGHTTAASLIGYRWELTGGLTADLAAPLYVSGDVRYVTVEEDPAFPRGNFADLRGEAGGRWRRDAATFVLYAAFERRNDVLLLAPSVENRVLLGFRVLYAGR